MSRDPFGSALDPFAWWDLAYTYDKYSGFFDLIIYSAIFIALAHTIFSHRFPGRAGKALSTAIGIALGVSLALAEQQFGWNLRKAGSIAVLLALLLIGFLLLHTMLRVHVSWTLAVPLTYIILYIFIRAVSPQLMRAIAERAPFINLISAIVFLICVWRLGVALWPKSKTPDSSSDDAAFIASLNQRREKNELKLEKNIGHHMVPKVQRQAKALKHSLSAVLHEIKRPQPRWNHASLVVKDISQISKRQYTTLDRIRILDKRLSAFDWQQLNELRSYCSSLDDTGREKLNKQIQMERRKILQEHAIAQIAERCEKRLSVFLNELQATGQAISNQNAQQAEHHLNKAIELEKQQIDDLNKLRTAEHKLIALTRLKLKKERKGKIS